MSMIQHPHQSSLGILNMKRAGEKFQLLRIPPSSDLSYFIKHYWIIHWDLTGQEPHLQDVVPNPCANLVVQLHRTAFYGVSSTRHSHHLEGRGQVFGIKFRPGGFYPFVNTSMDRLTDSSIGTMEILRVDSHTLEQQLLTAEEPEQKVRYMEELIRRVLPEEDEHIERIHTIIDHIHHNRDIIRVEQVSEWFQMSPRSLQRLFKQYVGVSPKWVIRLYRLQNAAEMLEGLDQQDALQLAMDMGYYDQSHFIRDFKAVIGKTPEVYMKER
ncbi:helix-turn-helix domain-containing protein [Paenibacillus sp. JZ16]|uniref:helix-turn-helix domain-containing protein n=1 Tax=Paenibacillus sp. JZ16 TaxID=1906272 RepID=UPI001F2D50F7|nr:helix-turn-helix domain-containing protein [Paenibacillus sp. JZ16]